jgi:hypothetical protein
VPISHSAAAAVDDEPDDQEPTDDDEQTEGDDLATVLNRIADLENRVAALEESADPPAETSTNDSVGGDYD